MTETEATQIIGVLAAGTTGWDDHAAQLWVAQLMTLDDFAAARDAVLTLVRSWTRPGHPPLGEFLATYRRELDRRPQPKRLEGVVTPRERAMRLAWEGYCSEARRLGKPTDEAHFLATMAGLVRQRDR